MDHIFRFYQTSHFWSRGCLRLFGIILFSGLAYGVTHSQTPSDALMMPSRQACALLNYQFGAFDEYWEGSLLRENQTVATVRRHTIMPMVAIGVFDWLNAYVGLPYVKTYSTEPNGGKFAGVSGLQDITIAMKSKIFEKETSTGDLSVMGAVGFSTPVTNYLSDYRPYSLGNGAPELTYRGILKYEFKNQLYLRVSGAYIWRGYTKAEREYYYNNGSYYTAWMDVPSAWQYEAIVGKWFLDKTLKVELNYTGLKSTSGDDIRPYNAAQPTNKVQFDQLGIIVQYYFKSIDGLGILLSHSRTLNGLNTGKVDTYGLGVTYFFNYLKRDENDK